MARGAAFGIEATSTAPLSEEGSAAADVEGATIIWVAGVHWSAVWRMVG
ncbi:hypothetical protein [Methylobacterium sp. J-068]|nr:hypothetical protein [Methylobacterium sp. J-068]MCJ2037128.1 hypothetical protein [Methylobacterium sp. J-068]